MLKQKNYNKCMKYMKIIQGGLKSIGSWAKMVDKSIVDGRGHQKLSLSKTV